MKGYLWWPPDLCGPATYKYGQLSQTGCQVQADLCCSTCAYTRTKLYHVMLMFNTCDRLVSKVLHLSINAVRQKYGDCPPLPCAGGPPGQGRGRHPNDDLPYSSMSAQRLLNATGPLALRHYFCQQQSNRLNSCTSQVLMYCSCVPTGDLVILCLLR